MEEETTSIESNTCSNGFFSAWPLENSNSAYSAPSSQLEIVGNFEHRLRMEDSSEATPSNSQASNFTNFSHIFDGSMGGGHFFGRTISTVSTNSSTANLFAAGGSRLEQAPNIGTTRATPTNKKHSSPNVESPPVNSFFDGITKASRLYSDFDLLDVIGTGSFGVVFRARGKIDQAMYAIKKSLRSFHTDKERNGMIHEVQALAALSAQQASDQTIGSSYIVRYYGTWIEDEHLCIQMELCDISVEELLAHQCSVHIRQGADAGAHTVSMGSPKKKRLPTSITNATVAASEQELIPAVQTKFSNSSTATPPAAQNTPEGITENALPSQALIDIDVLVMLRHMLLALSFLHRNSFVHLDIKPANILVKNGQYKLADFGLAVRVNPNGESNRTLVEEGDSRYLPKEMLDWVAVADLTKCDIFSLGISCYEVVTRVPMEMNGAMWHRLRNGVLPRRLDELRALREDKNAFESHATSKPVVESRSRCTTTESTSSEVSSAEPLQRLNAFKIDSPQSVSGDRRPRVGEDRHSPTPTHARASLSSLSLTTPIIPDASPSISTSISTDETLRNPTPTPTCSPIDMIPQPVYDVLKQMMAEKPTDRPTSDTCLKDHSCVQSELERMLQHSQQCVLDLEKKLKLQRDSAAVAASIASSGDASQSSRNKLKRHHSVV